MRKEEIVVLVLGLIYAVSRATLMYSYTNGYFDRSMVAVCQFLLNIGFAIFALFFVSLSKRG